MLEVCAEGRGFDSQPGQKVISISSPVRIILRVLLKVLFNYKQRKQNVRKKMLLNFFHVYTCIHHLAWYIKSFYYVMFSFLAC